MKYTKYLLVLFINISTYYHSTAQGWVKATNYYTKDLYDVCFTFSTTGVAVGDSGMILQTQSSGYQWQYIDAGIGNTKLNSVSLGGNNGFIVGNNGIILKTTNAGNSWSILNSGITSNLYSVIYLYNNTSLACGDFGTIIKTTDNGANWNIVYQDSTLLFTDICMKYSSKGIVVGYQKSDSTARILYSNDGGNNWNTANSMSNNALYTCVINNNNYSWVGGKLGTMQFSSDFGQNWALQNSTVNDEIRGMDYFNTSVVRAVSNNNIVISTNNGQSWTIENSISDQPLYAIDMLDSLRGCAVGKNGNILVYRVPRFTVSAANITNIHYNCINSNSCENAIITAHDIADTIFISVPVAFKINNSYNGNYYVLPDTTVSGLKSLSTEICYSPPYLNNDYDTIKIQTSGLDTLFIPVHGDSRPQLELHVSSAGYNFTSKPGVATNGKPFFFDAKSAHEYNITCPNGFEAAWFSGAQYLQIVDMGGLACANHDSLPFLVRFNPTTTGTFSGNVCIYLSSFTTAGNGYSGTKCFAVSGNSLGINTIDAAGAQLSVFPNPAKEKINILVNKEFESAKLKIYNVIGDEIYSGNITNKNHEILSDKWADGIYQINISNEKINYNTKIVIEH